MVSSIVRCAVYTRKSSEEGLEQSFNSLHAQREACEAYVLSQKHEGWSLIPTAYDDGGFSGGSMERPGLKALMADVEAGLIDTIVVYKVDRLTRSLADFAKMVERFDANGVSFVSITQAFNTTTSMGRLTLNVLLSFAQFEREVTGERIRDKIAASKAKGMWMGGAVPLGYDVVDRQLIVNEPEAEHVRKLFALYRRYKAVDTVVTHAAKLGIKSKARANRAGEVIGGGKLTRGSLYRIFDNPIYVGEIGHKDKRYPGQHEAIVDRKLFDAVQKILANNRRVARATRETAHIAVLAGLLVDEQGTTLTATFTSKAGKRYRYYVGGDLRVPAGEIEQAVTSNLAAALSNPAKLVDLIGNAALLSSAVIDRAAKLAAVLATGTAADQRRTLLDLVRSVTVGEGANVTVDLSAIGIPGATATITAATALMKRNAKLVLTLPGAAIAKPDHALISIVAQARDWMDLLTAGQATSIDALAARSRVTPAYIRQHIAAAFLAPDLVATIVEGRQPPGLNATTLQAMLPLPHDWAQQRSLFAALN